MVFSLFPLASKRDWMWKYHGRRGSVSDITKNGAFCDRVQRKKNGRLGLQPAIEIPRLYKPGPMRMTFIIF